MSETLELFNELHKWHKNNRGQLELIANGNDKVIVESTDGKKIEIKEDLLKGVRYGCVLALQIIGELPLTITSNEEE